MVFFLGLVVLFMSIARVSCATEQGFVGVDGEGNLRINAPEKGKVVVNGLDLEAIINQVLETKSASSAKASTIPSGAVFYFAMNKAPEGFLICNGSTVSRAMYSDLFEAIGTTFGQGDGVSNFALPDLRGQFIRGFADDSDRTFGSVELDSIKSHSHSASLSSNGNHRHLMFRNQGEGNTGWVDGNSAPKYSGVTGHTDYKYEIQRSTSGDANVGLTSNTGAHSHTVTVTANGGSETRPRNVALLPCIKT